MSGLKLGIKFLKPETRCRKGFLGLKWCRGLNPICYPVHATLRPFSPRGEGGGEQIPPPFPL